MASSQLLAQMSADSYNNEGQIPSGWSLVPVDLNDDQLRTGFFARAYKNNETNEIVIAFRGVDNLVGDAGAIADILFDRASGQFAAAEQFFKSVQELNPAATIALTGHSLGGVLAQYVMAKDF